MGIFNFLKAKKSTPKWADFFKQNEYSKFIQDLNDYFKGKCYIDEEEGVLKLEETESSYGLLNVAYICKENEKEKWPEIIKEHFEALFSSEKFSEEFSQKSSDFNFVKEYIAVRIYSSDYIESIGEDGIICERMNEDLFKTLVYDFPNTIQTIKKEELELWGKDTEELFSLGISNIKEKYEWEIEHVDMGEFKLWLIADDQGFATNILLDSENLEKYLGEKGAMVGIPNAKVAIIYPIESLEVINAIHTMANIISGEFNKAQAIIDKLYWCNNEKELIEVPFSITGNEIKVKPTQPFVDMLNSLAEQNS